MIKNIKSNKLKLITWLLSLWVYKPPLEIKVVFYFFRSLFFRLVTRFINYYLGSSKENVLPEPNSDFTEIDPP